ncbi:type II toxin-antitoxin system Phd/YefM family antitoxin [Vibrio owensii]|uniref:type II toxin-antitoxin system Phd/YefM family antitoxin n=1 Tax=Vibrio owensii TaxID=696485 RepID=UPI0018F10DF9|nr:type II toxin-antitoxin system Phd/YefM family antitoxin [Vibrio owensii]
MRTETVSFLKKHAADLPLDNPMIITQNGKPIYVVEDYNQRQSRDQAIALLKLVSFGQNDIKNGNVSTSEQFRDKLKARRTS